MWVWHLTVARRATVRCLALHAQGFCAWSAGMVAGCEPAIENVTCPSVTTPADASSEVGAGDYLGLGLRQQQAVGRIDPDLDDPESRDRLYCTGTMIAAGWVLTAGHCAVPPDKPLRFVVGEDSRLPVATWRSRRLHQHPTLDLLLVELDVSRSEVDDVLEPIAIASTSVLEVGETVEFAGYGVRPGDTPGPREHIAERLVQIDAKSFTIDGFGRSGACTHDSGAPLLARAVDGSARVFGVLYGGSLDCLGRDVFTRVDAARSWIRDRVGADCPSSSCGALTPTGRCIGGRAAWCDGGVVRGARCLEDETCGWDPDAGGFRCIEPGRASCAGTDELGRCLGATLERCSGAVRESADCSSGGGTCIVDTLGAATCT
jgi:hypothetical protein